MCRNFCFGTYNIYLSTLNNYIHVILSNIILANRKEQEWDTDG